MKHILLLNGPNLNRLGLRQPELYGHQTLADIEKRLCETAEIHGVKLSAFQSNHEGALVDSIHSAPGQGVDFIIINPGAFTHTSIALRDAFLSVNIPFIEVHLSNIFARESFRHHSYLADIAVSTISGCKEKGYDYALDFALTQRK